MTRHRSHICEIGHITWKRAPNPSTNNTISHSIICSKCNNHFYAQVNPNTSIICARSCFGPINGLTNTLNPSKHIRITYIRRHDDDDLVHLNMYTQLNNARATKRGSDLRFPQATWCSHTIHSYVRGNIFYTSGVCSYSCGQIKRNVHILTKKNVFRIFFAVEYAQIFIIIID